jgi:hypothetical protein
VLDHRHGSLGAATLLVDQTPELLIESLVAPLLAAQPSLVTHLDHLRWIVAPSMIAPVGTGREIATRPPLRSSPRDMPLALTGVSDRLIGVDDDAVSNRPCVHEPQRLQAPRVDLRDRTPSSETNSDMTIFAISLLLPICSCLRAQQIEFSKCAVLFVSSLSPPR